METPTVMVGQVSEKQAKPTRKSGVNRKSIKMLTPQAHNRRKSHNRKKISFDDNAHNESGHKSEFNRNRKSSVMAPPPDKRPEWYEDLTEEQVNMFKEIFEMLDSDGGGSISADELFVVLKDLDIEVTKEEIKGVLHDLDEDGNGEIDFDEFLYCMANSHNLMNQAEVAGPDDNGTYSKRQTLFFTAITRFAIKNSLGEIERYYANKQRQAPHVISCYTAGVRLIGLNDRQLEQEIRRMQKAARNNKSPYAKPLPFVLTDRKKVVKQKEKSKSKQTPKKQRPKTSVAKLPETHISIPTIACPSLSNINLPPNLTDSYVRDIEDIIDKTSHNSMVHRNRSGETRRAAITPEELEVIKLLHEMAENGNVVARLPGIHMVPQIRNKLVTGEALCSSIRKRRRTLSDKTTYHRTMSSASNHGHRRIEQRPKSRSIRGWVIPRMEIKKAPLPVIKLSDDNVVKEFTIEDVNDIRKWVSESMSEYYSALRTAHVKTAHQHWDELHTDQIKSRRLRELFRQVYHAYCPHEEDELFTISPWIPDGLYFKLKCSSCRAPPVGPERRIGYCYSAPPFEMKQCGFKQNRQKKRTSQGVSVAGQVPSRLGTPVINSRPSSRMGASPNVSYFRE